MGFDHGVGHPLLLLYNAKAPNCRKNKALNGLGHYAEWPKVADAVIKAGFDLQISLIVPIFIGVRAKVHLRVAVHIQGGLRHFW